MLQAMGLILSTTNNNEEEEEKEKFNVLSYYVFYIN
jgi:hypothetical protein